MRWREAVQRSDRQRLSTSIVQAGTGTGKTMAYLVPAVLTGKRIVVATATKALQDQLAAKDLPFLEAHLGRPFDWAVLKGRSNYICMQRVRELQSSAAQGQLEIEEFAETTKAEIKRLVEWSGTTKTGDQADLTWSPADRSRGRRSASAATSAPAARKCPMGAVCFAELARATCHGRRRRGRQPPPLRAQRRQRERAAARTRRGRDRRGPSTRRHHERHGRACRSAPAGSPIWLPSCAG